MNVLEDYHPTYAELVSFLHNTGFHAAVPLNSYARKVMENAEFLCVQDENGFVMGLSIIYLNRKEKDFAYLTYIAVCENARRMGVGKALLIETIHAARKRGFERLRLEVKAQNKIARRLYETQGFCFVEELERSYYMELMLKND